MTRRRRLQLLSGVILPLSDLNSREREVVRECLQAAVEGPFFPEWEFSTLFGLTRDEVRKVLSSWPDGNESDKFVVAAINKLIQQSLRLSVAR